MTEEKLSSVLAELRGREAVLREKDRMIEQLRSELTRNSSSLQQLVKTSTYVLAAAVAGVAACVYAIFTK